MFPSRVPGGTISAQNPGRKAQPLEQFRRPRHRFGIEELRGAGDGGLGFRHAGQPVVEQIRNIEQPRRRVQGGRSAQRMAYN